MRIAFSVRARVWELVTAFPPSKPGSGPRYGGSCLPGSKSRQKPGGWTLGNAVGERIAEKIGSNKPNQRRAARRGTLKKLHSRGVCLPLRPLLSVYNRFSYILLIQSRRRRLRGSRWWCASRGRKVTALGAVRAPARAAADPLSLPCAAEGLRLDPPGIAVWSPDLGLLLGAGGAGTRRVPGGTQNWVGSCICPLEKEGMSDASGERSVWQNVSGACGGGGE